MHENPIETNSVTTFSTVKEPLVYKVRSLFLLENKQLVFFLTPFFNRGKLIIRVIKVCSRYLDSCDFICPISIHPLFNNLNVIALRSSVLFYLSDISLLVPVKVQLPSPFKLSLFVSKQNFE